jgi:hypothetical protein
VLNRTHDKHEESINDCIVIVARKPRARDALSLTINGILR